MKDVIAGIMQSVASTALEAEATEARKNPLSNKNTLVFEKPANYAFFLARNGRGHDVRFCWSVHQNAAGFFLGWREVVGKDKLKRDQFVSRRVRHKVKSIARRRAEALSNKP